MGLCWISILSQNTILGRNVVFGIIRDITERKRTETELREAYEQITATEKN